MISHLQAFSLVETDEFNIMLAFANVTEIDEDSELGKKVQSITRCHNSPFSVNNLSRKQFEGEKIIGMERDLRKRKTNTHFLLS